MEENKKVSWLNGFNIYLNGFKIYLNGFKIYLKNSKIRSLDKTYNTLTDT